MKRVVFLLLYSVGLMLCLSTCAYKSYTKKGVRYEAAGLYKTATEHYLLALGKKSDYIDARIGLIRAATRYAEELEDLIETNYAALKDDAVVSYYMSFTALRQQCAKYDVDIVIPPRIDGQFTEAKNRYLSDTYRNAEALMDAEKFSDAAVLFQKVLDVDSTYENAKKHLVFCKCEPLYRQAVQHMSSARYRSAYTLLSRVLSIDNSYKDTYDLRQEAVYKGVLTVAFLSVQNANGHANLSSQMISEVNRLVQKDNDPFLKMVDLKQTGALLQEQKLAIQNNLDFKSAIVPVRAHLSTTINAVTYTKTKLEKVKKKGFLKEIQPDKTVKYKKIYYYDYRQSCTATAKVTYGLTSTETGLLLFNGEAFATVNDSIYYIYYDGRNDSNIRMGSWENQLTAFDPAVDRVEDTYFSASTISKLVNARQILLTVDVLEKDMGVTIGKTIANKLISYNPEQ